MGKFEDPSDVQGFYDPVLLAMSAEDSFRMKKLLEFTQRMKEFKGPSEESHIEADEILCEVCNLLVMSPQEKDIVDELLEAYNHLDMWYA